MRLRKLIGEIGAKFDRLLPMSSPAHVLLGRAEVEFRQWIPSGYQAEGYGGNSEPAIAIFNPAETTTAQRGMYVAYLFSADKSTVTLTLNQGVGEMAEHLGRSRARTVLALQAATIRAAMSPAEIAGLDLSFDLRTSAAIAVDYEQANIVSRTYSLDRLPVESELVADLQRFLLLYALALQARETARRQGRHDLITPLQSPAAKKPTEPKAALKLAVEPKPAAIAPEPKPATVEPVAKLKPAAEPKTTIKAPSAEVKPTPPAAEPKPAAVKPEPKAPAAKPETKVKLKKAAIEPVLASKPATTAELESDTAAALKVSGKHKALAGTLTRRGILAALVATPFVYATPRAEGAHTQDLVPKVLELPAQTTPVFTIDVSQHDWKRHGGNLDWAKICQAGIAGMCARATYGDPSGYRWPTHYFGDFSRAARKAGMGLRGGYHNLVKGDQASINRQVDWLRRELDRHSANWAMLDVERYAELIKADMVPTWDDVRRFDDRWAEVDSRVLVAYIPPWNWTQHLGQPDLREFRGPLIASNYPRQAHEDFRQLYQKIGGNDGRGWATYGNRVPEGWQYSARAKVPGVADICDVNAWRLTFEKFKVLLTGTQQSS